MYLFFQKKLVLKGVFLYTKYIEVVKIKCTVSSVG